jgi:hypothetical protein
MALAASFSESHWAWRLLVNYRSQGEGHASAGVLHTMRYNLPRLLLLSLLLG